MTEDDDEEKEGFSLSSSALQQKKKSEHRKLKTTQETASTTSASIDPSSNSLSPLMVLHGGDDQTAMASGEIRNSQSSSATTEQAANLSSKPASDSAIQLPLLNAPALEPVIAITNSIEEDKNAGAISTESDDAVDANHASITTHSSKVFTTNSRKPLEKDSRTKSNHSRSGRRSRRGRRDGRSIRRARSRSRTLSRGSNSMRSIGLQNISRSSHCTISAHTMASSLNSGTDSDLDSLYSEDDFYNELLSDDENDDYHSKDQQNEKYQQFMMAGDEDDDIQEYDGLYREKSQNDERGASYELDTPLSVSYVNGHTDNPKEFLNEATEQLETAESSAIASPSGTLAGESSTKLLLETPDSSAKESLSQLLPQQLSQQQSDTECLKEGMPSVVTSSRGKGDFADNDVNTGNSILLSDDYLKKVERDSQHLRRTTEINRNNVVEERSGQGSHSLYGELELNPAPFKRQVLWANQLSEQYSNNSDDAIIREKLPDYEMDLEKGLNTSVDNNIVGNFLEILEQSIINSEHTRRNSLSSTSINTLNSSNRQDSFSDRDFETESSVISQTLRNSASHASSPFRTSSNLVDSGRDRGIAIETSRITELNSKSLSNLHDSQADISGVSLSSHQKIAVETSLSSQSSSRHDLNRKPLNHRENNKFSIENRRPNSGVEEKPFHRGQAAVHMGQRYSFSATDPEISEDFYDHFFAPRDEPKSVDRGGDSDVPKQHKKSSMSYCGIEDENRTPNFSYHSNYLMEYSVSRCPGDNAPISTTRSQEFEMSSLPSSVRVRRHVVRGLCAFLILFVCGLTVYFFVGFDNDDEKYPTQIEPLFLIDP